MFKQTQSPVGLSAQAVQPNNVGIGQFLYENSMFNNNNNGNSTNGLLDKSKTNNTNNVLGTEPMAGAGNIGYIPQQYKGLGNIGYNPQNSNYNIMGGAELI
jgi:hypothetical protein